MSFAWRLLIGVVIAALVEEIYLRGALFSVHGEEVGTSACLLFGGIVFALLHGSPLDLAAGFCAGLAFTYLTYVFDTVWAAVLSACCGGICHRGDAVDSRYLCTVRHLELFCCR